LGHRGTTHLDLGEVEEAIKDYREDFEISLEIGDRRGQGYALAHRGMAYRERGKGGDVIDAINDHEQALVIAIERDDKPSRGYVLSQLGMDYAKLNNHLLAIDFYQKALTFQKESLGPEHMNVAVTLRNLARAYYNIKSHEEAEGHFKQALYIYERKLPPDHLDLATLLDDYVDLLRDMNHPAEAARLAGRARDIRAQSAKNSAKNSGRKVLSQVLNR